MSGLMPFMRDGVGKLEAFSDLCAFERAHQGTLERKRARLAEEGLLISSMTNTHPHESTVGSNFRQDSNPMDQTTAAFVDELTSCMDEDAGGFDKVVETTDQKQHEQQQQQHSATVAGRGQKAEQSQRIKRPMNPFMIWAKDERSAILGQNPTMHNSDVSRQLGRNWRGMTEEQKQPYVLEAERLAEEHKRLHPNYKYRPRKKDPNIRNVRGRRLDSEALKYVANALTKQEISACVSGNPTSYIKRASRPSSVNLGAAYHFAYQPTTIVDTTAEQLEKALIAASAPVTPVTERRDIPTFDEPVTHSNHHRYPSQATLQSTYEMVKPAASERGWYSCPPSPTSFSEKVYPSMQPGALTERRRRHLEQASLVESPQTEEFSSPPPLMDKGRYQPSMTPSGPPPPPPLSSRSQPQQSQNAGASHPHHAQAPFETDPITPAPITPAPITSAPVTPAPPLLTHDSRPQSNHFTFPTAEADSYHQQRQQTDHRLQHYQPEQQGQQQQQNFSSMNRQHIPTPPRREQADPVSSNERQSYAPLHSPPETTRNAPYMLTWQTSQVSTLATKILSAIMVKQQDEDGGVQDDPAYQHTTEPGQQHYAKNQRSSPIRQQQQHQHPQQDPQQHGRHQMTSSPTTHQQSQYFSQQAPQQPPQLPPPAPLPAPTSHITDHLPLRDQYHQEQQVHWQQSNTPTRQMDGHYYQP